MKLEVTAKQATELMAQGYEIECYLTLPPATKPGHKTHIQQVKPSAKLTLSLEAKEPQQGKIAVIWPKVKEKFWTNPTNTVPRKEVEAYTVKIGGVKNHVSQFLHAYSCLRVVED